MKLKDRVNLLDERFYRRTDNHYYQPLSDDLRYQIKDGITALRDFDDKLIQNDEDAVVLREFYKKRENSQMDKESYERKFAEISERRAIDANNMEYRIREYLACDEAIRTGTVNFNHNGTIMEHALQHAKKSLDKPMSRREYLRNVSDIRNIVHTTSQLLSIGDSKSAAIFGTVADASIQIYEAKQTISCAMETLKEGGKLTWGSALPMLSGFATFVSAGLTIAALFGRKKNDKSMQLIMNQLVRIRQDILDFRKEVAESLQKISNQIGTFQQEINRRLDELVYIMENNGERLEKCIQEVHQVNYVSNLDELQRVINKAKATRSKDKASVLSDLTSWAQANCTFASLTGSDLALDTKDITSSLKDKSIEGKLGYLKEIANKVILKNPNISPDCIIANPVFWRNAVFAYIDTLISLPEDVRNGYINDEAFDEEFKQILEVGKNLQEFVKQTQTNKELFDTLFKNYKDSIGKFYDELVKSNNLQDPRVQKCLEQIGKCYEELRAFSELAFNQSFNEDPIFSYLMKRSHQNDQLVMKDATENIQLLRLLNADDLTTLFSQNFDLDFRKAIAIQLRQMSDMYKAAVDYKINSVIDGGAIEPYGIVEDTLDTLMQFNKEYLKDRFKEDKLTIQMPNIRRLPIDYFETLDYADVEKKDMYVINTNVTEHNFDQTIRPDGDATTKRIEKGNYMVEVLEENAVYYDAKFSESLVLEALDTVKRSPHSIHRDWLNLHQYLADGFYLSKYFSFGYPGKTMPLSKQGEIFIITKPKTYKLKMFANNAQTTNNTLELETLLPNINKSLYNTVESSL